DPGRQRDTSMVKDGHFDRMFPIDLDFEVAVAAGLGEVSVATFAEELKRALPFLFRYANRIGDLNALTVQPHNGTMPVRRQFELLARSLPTDWAIVALPGYIIAYPDDSPRRYPSRIGSWQTDGESG